MSDPLPESRAMSSREAGGPDVASEARAAAADPVRAGTATAAAGDRQTGRVNPSVVDSLVGTVLADRYEIVRRIGEGGMGAVYEARHAVIGKRVAVKVLLEKFLEKPELVARLLQEARLASSIGHENIVDVTDFGTTADGRAFVVMEFLEGESLAQLVMRDAPLPLERSLRIVRQVASALGAAHAKGIVHRDVKPENVYLVRRGELDFVKVVDFGVSKAVHASDEGPEWQRLTRTGMVLGTPLYMSPEQARGGDDVDARADIWAVGVMLYECLTGEVPFRASNYLGVISQVLTVQAVSLSRLRPELGIPPAVETVVMRALEKDRARRYQQMSDLERDLERLLAGDHNVGLPAAEIVAPAPPPVPAHRWHLGVAAVVLIGVGLAVALARTEEGRPRPAVKPVLASPPPPAAPTAPNSPVMGAELLLVPHGIKPPPAGHEQRPPAAHEQRPPARKSRAGVAVDHAADRPVPTGSQTAAKLVGSELLLVPAPSPPEKARPPSPRGTSPDENQ
jgi:serine/threonine-protein kinase